MFPYIPGRDHLTLIKLSRDGIFESSIVAPGVFQDISKSSPTFSISDSTQKSFFDHKNELMSQKYAKGLRVTIDYIEDKDNGDSIEIYDDAYGMEWPDFQRAVVLDRPPQKTTGRNEFGMGLKTAACWFGSIWSVESTQLGSRNKYYTEINIDDLGKYKTEEIDVREEIVSTKEHYTKIVIKKFLCMAETICGITYG